MRRASRAPPCRCSPQDRRAFAQRAYASSAAARAPRCQTRVLLPNHMCGVLSSEKKTQRGGWRPNAGRKKSRELRYDASHARRPELSFQHPVHVMLRTLWSVLPLRQREGYEAIRRALVHYVDGTDFRVVHISIQKQHLHLIVEATHKDALRRGMQSFAIRA